jgi:hypothetical protein
VPVIAPARRDHGALLVVCLLSGCSMEVPGDEPAPLDDLAMLADNGIFLDNGLKLTNGADAGNGIKLTNGFDLSNGLDLANGIKLTNGVNTIEPPPGSDLEKWIDADPTMRLRVIRYQVECALPAGTAIDVVYRGTAFSFVGQIGLGPSWLVDRMTQTDREGVSACLLARVNARGDQLRITLVGPYAGLNSVTAEELAAYPVREATFFGDLFSSPPTAHVTSMGACGSRACRAVDGFCECGILSPGDGCIDSGLGYDTQCEAGEWHRVYSYPMTTYVAQELPGGACASDGDCIYHNCLAGTCGAAGAACVGGGVGGWYWMCADPLGCGDDSTCGGDGAWCGTDDAACTGGNCSSSGWCGSPCRRNRDCPSGMVCDVDRRACVP